MKDPDVILLQQHTIVYIGISLLFISNSLSGRLWSEQWIFVIPLIGVLDRAAAYNCLVHIGLDSKQSLETIYIVVFWKPAVLNKWFFRINGQSGEWSFYRLC